MAKESSPYPDIDDDHLSDIFLATENTSWPLKKCVYLLFQ